ncbi:ATP-binding protein [Maridesulfovibrio zosterae]|uniref:ATP-binding protein n=1 Tax=Maridesulfovibrio zosterae TaxID=82171 RepID=UPI00041138D6|nr:ATP-binding protein [Maridesulfovibrio zosterae]
MIQDKAYILILDDEPTNLYLLKNILEMEDNVVPISASTGEEALLLLKEREYALAIIDMHLPGIDGLEVIRQMRESDKMREIPVLIASAVFKDSESIAQGYELGVADYLFKPLNTKMLRSKVSLFTKFYFNRKALEASEASLSLTQHMAGLGGWELDLDTMELYWSHETYLIHKVGPEFTPNLQNALGFYAPLHQSVITEAVKRCIEEGESFDLELEIVTAEDCKLWVRALGEPIYDNSRIVKIGGTFQDISEQRARMELVEQSREKYQQLYGAIRDAILIADMDRNIVDMNPAFNDLFGYSVDDLKGKPTVTIYKDESEFKRLGELIRQNDNPNDNIVYTIHYQKKSGQVFSGETAIFKIYDAKGDVTGFMGLIRDISEKENLEQQLAYARKLESIGQLAAGVAHEINTPIMYISGNIKFLKESFDNISQLLEKQNKLYLAVKDNQDVSSLLPCIEQAMETAGLDFLLDEIPQALSESQEGTERVSHIVQAMKIFSHMDINTVKPMNVNDAVENTITIASNEWKYHSEIVMNLAEDLPLIEGVLGDFNQAILNILVNAAHANSDMVKKNGGKGTITISTALDGEFVEICISDTGTGIPPENQHRIFDPFFTTKEVGKGTGQGLSITHTIVKKHGGTIAFNSEENKGTTFFLTFPIKQESRGKDCSLQ